ncbi:MAG: CBS domain-containing protein, partial [Thermoplasmata archaeon]|nr:CBS domain-containing protein [Thermoplasmata archaeon]
KDLGKASFRKRERATRGDSGGEQITAKIKVGSVMRAPPITIGETQTIVEAVSLMNDNSISTIIVTEKDRPVGIVTQYDLIELIASFKHEEQVFVQISGLHEADPESYDIMYELIQKNIKRVSKIITPKIFTIHVTTQEAGSDHMSGDVTIRGRMTTEHEMYYSTAIDWDLMKALSTMLSHIEKSIRKDKEKRDKAVRKK